MTGTNVVKQEWCVIFFRFEFFPAIVCTLKKISVLSQHYSRRYLVESFADPDQIFRFCCGASYCVKLINFISGSFATRAL
jgi:hypothetical protein